MYTGWINIFAKWVTELPNVSTIRCMKKLLVLALTALLLVSGLPANAAIKAGGVCKTKGQVKVSGGKEFTCVKKGSRLVWSQSLSAKPSATPKTKLNDLAGMAWIQKNNGAMNLALIMKSIKSNFAFIADGIDYQTAYPGNFQPQDIWDDKIIACSSYCLNEFYVSSLKGNDLKPISLDKIQHPDIFSYSIMKGVNFGSDSRYVFALTSFQPIDGVKSVVYRIDTLTGSKTPIYTTYCYSSVSKSCAYGYVITGLKADHHSDKLLISVDSIETADNGFTSSYLTSISQNSGAVTLKSYKSFLPDKKLYYEYSNDSNAIWLVVNNVSDSKPAVRMTNLQFLDSGEYLYSKTSGENGREMNQICKVQTSKVELCNPIAPFTYLSDLIPLGDGLVLYTTLNFNTDEFAAGLYDLNSQKITPITNYASNVWFEAFSVGG